MATALAVALCSVIPCDARSQEPSELHRNLVSELAGNTRRATAFDRHARCVVLLGHPDGGFGTGFVISRKQRLIATAAHVADHLIENGSRMVAVPHGSHRSYSIQRVWYHPRIVRKLDEGLFAPSDDPRDGEIADCVADLAVLQLSADGPDLPDELTLAAANELAPSEGTHAMVIGFGDSTEGHWPDTSQRAIATHATAVLRRLTDESERGEGPVEKRSWVWFESKVQAGMSGAPLLLENGHVIALVARMDPLRGKQAPFCDGYRVDCLRELLAYHGLSELNPRGMKSAFRPRSAVATPGSLSFAWLSSTYARLRRFAWLAITWQHPKSAMRHSGWHLNMLVLI